MATAMVAWGYRGMNEAWAVVAAALGSAVLTISGTFWLERYRLGRGAKAAEDDRLRAACVLMATHALLFALRADILYRTAMIRSGIREGPDIALYRRKPIDPMGVSDWLRVDLEPMIEAQSLIQMMAGEDLIHAASDLVNRAAEILGKASRTTSSPPGRDSPGWWMIADRLKVLAPLSRNLEAEREIQQAIRELGQKLREFSVLTRQRLGVNDPDAVIRAFPQLYPDASPSEDPSLPRS